MAVARNGSVWLQYRDEGPRAAEPVLHIMGLGGSGRAWYRLLPHVTPTHRALTFDHRGTGNSDPVGRPLRMGDLVGDALAVLDAAGESSAHVHGVSLGGMVAQQLALDHPERVRSLILSATSAGGLIANEPPWRLLAAGGIRPLVGPDRAWALLNGVLYSARTRNEFPARMAEDAQLRLEDGNDPRTVLAQLAAVARHDTRRRIHALARLPVTVIHGAEDVLIPPRAGRALAAAIPGARLVVIDDAGHLLGTDAEESWADAVLTHLARVTLEQRLAV
ncbi:MAG: alpha/beta fold hydrolase [Solirubrobacteraceae bacterium]|nr:alpha/beta fold hydrolase [Solirubrobacteraceae bacterium]